MREVLLVVALAWSGLSCVESKTKTCGTSICPTDTICVEELNACFDQFAVDACQDLADATDCSTPTVAQGRCYSGVCRPQECGNGVLDGLEDCDGDDLGGATCASVGYYDDTPGLKCGLDCRFDGSECTGFCGDGVANGNEPCDGDDVIVDCATFGYYETEGVVCSPICTAITDMCEQVCGDGVINGPELCDASQPAATCLDLGFDRGYTDCSSVCAVDFVGCGSIGHKGIPQVTPANLHLWESPSGRIYGSGLDLLEFDGENWVSLGQPTGYSTDLWGTSDTNLYGSSALEGALFHFDGTTSTTIDMPGGADNTQSVHGTSASDIYVATSIEVVHYDGNTWTEIGGPVANDIYAIDANNVFAVEAVGGGVWHYNGVDTWTETNDTGYTDKLTTIWGTSTTRLFAAGLGVVLSYDGTDWTRILDEDDATAIINVTGNQDLLLAIGNDGFFEYDGVGWIEHDTSTTAILNPSDAMVRNDGSLLLIGGGTSIFAGAGAISSTWFWGLNPTGYSWSLNDLLAFSKHELLAVGHRTTGNFLDPKQVGEVARYTDGTWQRFAEILPVDTGLRAVWSGDGGATAIAVGDQGTIQRITGNTMTTDTTPITTNLNGVWGSASNNIVAVGASGVVLRYGGSWVAESVPTTANLHAVTGFAPSDIYAVGGQGTVLHYDGSAWTLIDVGTTALLLDVWGSGPDDIFIVGAGGTIIHYDGSTWESVETPTVFSLQNVDGTGPNNVFAAGGGPGLGVILHYDGEKWGHVETRIPPGSSRSIFSLATLGNNAFFAGTLGHFEHLFWR